MNGTEGFRFTVFTVPGLNRNKLFSLRKQAAERKQALQDQFSESKHWENREVFVKDIQKIFKRLRY